MKLIVVMLWLIVVLELLSFCAYCLNQANTIQNYFGMMLAAVIFILTYKYRFGLRFFKKVENPNV